MTKSMKLAGACVALLAGSTVFAQEAQTQVPVPSSTGTTSAGLLGKRYVETGFAFVDVNKTKTDAFGTGLAVNLPVASNIDVGFNYNYAWVEGHSDVNAHSIGASVTEYVDVKGFNLFTTLSLGYAWLDQYDEETVWGADVGAEYSFNSKLSAIVSVGYSDNFHGPSDDGVWDGTVRANYWLTERLAANATLSIIEGGDVSYGAGVSLKF